jgi:hypothetical protein
VTRPSSRRTAAVVAVGAAATAVVLLVVAAVVAAPWGRSSCDGGWRWDVKTLSDSSAAAVSFAPVATTISTLIASTPPAPLDGATPRTAGVEETTWRVTATLDHMDRQADGDIHLVIADPRDQTKKMLAEFPDVTCPGPDHSLKQGQLRAARRALLRACGSVPAEGTKELLRGKAVITGVGFFDENTKFNPNGVEIHPVLALKSLAPCKRLRAVPASAPEPGG